MANGDGDGYGNGNSDGEGHGDERGHAHGTGHGEQREYGEHGTEHGEPLGEMAERYRPQLHRFALRLTRDPHLSEDLAHEALLRAWRSPNRPTEAEGLRPWLHTIVRNLVIDDRRSAWRRREVVREELPEQAASDRTEAIFEGMLVREALAGLPPHHREVVVLAHFRHLSVAEIAAELDLAPGTVKSRLHYALRAMRMALQEQGVIR